MKATVNIMGGTFPTQAFGTLEDGRHFYFRYRHGGLWLYETNGCDWNNSTIFWDRLLYQFTVEEGWDSSTLPDKLNDMTSGVIEWNIPESSLPEACQRERANRKAS